MNFTDLMYKKNKHVWKLSMALSFSLFCMHSYAQQNIQGKVVKSYDKTPVEGAIVSILNSTHTTRRNRMEHLFSIIYEMSRQLFGFGVPDSLNHVLKCWGVTKLK